MVFYGVSEVFFSIFIVFYGFFEVFLMLLWCF
jgi:hypothetical protein